MTDLAAAQPRAVETADGKARARLVRRYRAERRFKYYGVAAIVFAALFVLVLLLDIVIKALPAFTLYRLVLDVPVTAEALGVSDPADRSELERADFLAPIRQRLVEVIPAGNDRQSRRQLYRILSLAASDPLRERVMRNPALIGQTIEVPVLLGDEADLYLAGRVSRTDRSDGQSAAIPSGTRGTVTIRTRSDEFADDLAAVKSTLSRTARGLRLEAERLQRARSRIEDQLASSRRALAAAAPAEQAVQENRIAQHERDLASLSAAIQEHFERAASLELRFRDAGGAEPLDPSVPSLLLAINGGFVKVTRLEPSQATGEVLLPLRSSDNAAPGQWQVFRIAVPESARGIKDQEIAFLEHLRQDGRVERGFNWRFFTYGDSREAELAGILGALAGSALTMLVTLVLCLPIGVAAAIYLEEFAPKNRWTGLVEVNINNLAAVPSIVFGLLGLAVFLNFFGLPRSAPLVGGLVLALLVLPTIIIASRAALKAVPPSIREGALAIGASHQQTVFHHVLPLAVPGILTGTIIGMAHALGETAPLLMIGMVAFIVDVPGGITDAATALPVQIYLWSDLPEMGFQAKTAAAIIVLLLFLFVMNALAVLLRRRFERRW